MEYSGLLWKEVQEYDHRRFGPIVWGNTNIHIILEESQVVEMKIRFGTMLFLLFVVLVE